MQCDYYDAGRCRSCTLMGVPYAAQLAAGQDQVAATLHGLVPALAWLPPQASAEAGFRNKAKLVVGGRKGAPTVASSTVTGAGWTCATAACTSPRCTRPSSRSRSCWPGRA